MSATGVRHFFVLEASEYVERLDGVVAAAGERGPDAEALLRVARALRGAASMARLDALVGLGAAVERVARAVRDQVLPWDERTAASLRGAVEDLRSLIARARSWSPEDDARAERRTADLLGLAPPSPAAPTAAGPLAPPVAAGAPRVGGSADPVALGSGTLHLVHGAAELAAALTAAAVRGDDPAPLVDARRRAGALRGVAAVADHPALSELLDTLDATFRPLEAPLAREARDALVAAGRLLRRASDALRAGRVLEPDGEWQAVDERLRALAELGGTAQVVPITELFHDDAGPHVLTEAEQPPTTPLARFRVESAGQAEHVRRLVAQARHGDGERAGGRIGAALLALRDVAESYGETELARLIASGAQSAAQADPLTLDAIDALASRLLAEAGSVEELCDRLRDLARGHRLAAMIGTGLAPLAPGRSPSRGFTPRSMTPAAGASLVGGSGSAAPAGSAGSAPDAAPTAPAGPPTAERGPAAPAAEAPPEAVGPFAEAPPRVPTPATLAAARAEARPDERSEPRADAAPAGAPPARAASRTPTGSALKALLASSLTGLERLEHEPMAAPAAVEEEVVPIERLVYDPAGALRRALALRDELRAHGDAPPRAQLEELYDLLDYATRA